MRKTCLPWTTWTRGVDRAAVMRLGGPTPPWTTLDHLGPPRKTDTFLAPEPAKLVKCRSTLDHPDRFKSAGTTRCVIVQIGGSDRRSSTFDNPQNGPGFTFHRPPVVNHMAESESKLDMDQFGCAICGGSMTQDHPHALLTADVDSRHSESTEYYRMHVDCFKSVSEGWMFEGNQPVHQNP